MLYLISIGLSDEKDMSIRAIESAKRCDILFVEFYTTQLNTTVERLSKLIGKEIKELKREDLEEGSEKILTLAENKNVGILVGGDALIATTHSSLLIDAKKRGIRTKIVHGSSIYTAVCSTGLQIYKFGRTVTLPDFKAASVVDAIKRNKRAGLHTLVLLDVKMNAKEGLKKLLDEKAITKEDKIIACCRLGSREEIIKYDKTENLLKNKEIEKMPGVLIIPGRLHFKEEEALSFFRYPKSNK
ncbi:MAG: diphthine synthase [Candidatus Aenigmatarchaeota archaeon]